MKCVAPGLLLIGLCAFAKTATAQYSNDAGAREKHFIYEIKQVDEFFERFNDDKDSFIRKVYASYKKKYNIKREDLVKTLFNYETNSWNPVIIDSFISYITNKEHPKLLNFYGKNWYAEANCRFQYEGTEIDVPVILKLDADANNRARWIIESVKKNPFPPAGNDLKITVKDRSKFIHPASHTNNFIALSKALEDKENLPVYFDESFFRRDNSTAFFATILYNRAQLLYVKSIRYHFLQVDGWVFTVESFPRKSLNSGWLISSLQKITPSEKHQYEDTLLGK
ncbi:MAG: hypothetical protein QM802_03390 [Agriterribacter sp.]